MIVEGKVQPATIRRGVTITDIASCSCDSSCNHKIICAIDTKSRVYLSSDAKKFTAKKDLSRGTPPLGLFSTGAGALILYPDMTYDTVEDVYTNNRILDGVLGAVKKMQKDSPNLKIIDMEAAQSEAMVALSDGTVVVSSAWERSPFSRVDPKLLNPDIEMIGELEMMISGDNLKDSNGHHVTKVTETSIAFALIFEDSNEFILFDVKQKKMKRVTADVKVEDVFIVKGETFITSPDKRIHRADSLLDRFWGKSNEILKTEPVEDSTGAEKVWTRSKARAESLGQGKVKVYPTKSSVNSRHYGEEQIDPVTVFLPSNLKNLTLTNSVNFSTRVNILTEEGEIFAMHFRW